MLPLLGSVSLVVEFNQTKNRGKQVIEGTPFNILFCDQGPIFFELNVHYKTLGQHLWVKSNPERERK